MKELQTILKDLYLISGLNISIFDIDEKLITSYPEKKSMFCSLIAKNPSGLKKCKECDHNAFLKVRETGQIYIYQCYFHLYEAAVPLYTYGIHTGYLMMGQTLTDSPFDKEEIKNKALNYIDNKEELEKAIKKISIHTREQILSFSNIIDICAKYLTLTNRIEYKKKDLAFQVKEYLIHNYNKEISIDFLCQLFYCSKSTLINHFKKEYQTTIHQFLLDYRLEKAVELLKNDNLSIVEISITCGFQDPNYFSKAFKHKYHISPSKYKEKNA